MAEDLEFGRVRPSGLVPSPSLATEPATPSDVVVRVVTYTSASAPLGYEAVAHLWLDGARLPIVFSASTTDSAERAARAHWAAEMEKHGAAIANRAEGRRRAAEARALKASQTPPASDGEASKRDSARATEPKGES